MVLQGLYKNGLHPICYLVHNLFKLNVLYLLYVNLIAVYRMGLSLDLCYMFCMPCQWLLNFSLTFSKARKSALRTRLLATGCEAGGGALQVGTCLLYFYQTGHTTVITYSDEGNL